MSQVTTLKDLGNRTPTVVRIVYCITTTWSVCLLTKTSSKKNNLSLKLTASLSLS